MRTNTCPVLLAGMNSQLALGLPAVAPSDTVVINARCTVRTEGNQRVNVVGSLPVYHFSPAPTRLHAVPDSTCRISVLASLGACKDLWAGSRFFVGRR